MINLSKTCAKDEVLLFNLSRLLHVCLRARPFHQQERNSCNGVLGESPRFFLSRSYESRKFCVLSNFISSKNLKSTKRHLFFVVEKVLICIERGIFCTDNKEINTFENVIFWKRCSFFTIQLSCTDPLARLKEKGNTFCDNHIYILYIKKIVYIETLVFGLLYKRNFPYEWSSISDTVGHICIS